MHPASLFPFTPPALEKTFFLLGSFVTVLVTPYGWFSCTVQAHFCVTDVRAATSEEGRETDVFLGERTVASAVLPGTLCFFYLLNLLFSDSRFT